MLPDVLLKGYKGFKFSLTDRDHAHFEELRVEGQSPKVMIIGCCDSRVDPTRIFNADHGTIFTLRNIANVVPDFAGQDRWSSVSAALEHGVKNIGVEHIVIVGHERCSGIHAALEQKISGQSQGDYVDHWLDVLASPRDKVLARMPGADIEQQAAELERESILTSIANTKALGFVREAMDAGRLVVHGAFFAFGGSELFVYEEAEQAWVNVDEA